ncbi:MAG: tetratricopeptide repeat protein, partial [bacterium]
AVTFRRASRAGENIVYAGAFDLPGQRFRDVTRAGKIAKVNVTAVPGNYGAGSKVLFSLKPVDSFGNPAADRRLGLEFSVPEGGDAPKRFTVETDRDGRCGQPVDMPERAGVVCGLRVWSDEDGFEYRTSFTVGAGAPHRALFHPPGGKTEAGSEFTLAVRLEDEHGNPVTGEYLSLMIKSSSGGKWKIAEADDTITGGDGACAFRVLAPGAPGAEAVFAVSSTGFRADEGSSVRFTTAPAGTAGAFDTAPPWETKGKKAAVRDPEKESRMEKDEETPEIQPAADAPAPVMPAVEFIPLADEEPPIMEMPREVLEGIPAGGGGNAGSNAAGNAVGNAVGNAFSALEGLDFDAGADVFGTGAAPAAAPVEPPQPETSLPAGKSAPAGKIATFDELEMMLADDAGAPRAQTLREPIETAGIETAGDAGWEPEPPAAPTGRAEVRDEASMFTGGEGAEEETPPPPAEPRMEVLGAEKGRGEGLRVVVEKQQVESEAGDVIPVVARVENSDGERLPGRRVAFSIEEDSAGGMDSAFTLPTGDTGGAAYAGETDMAGTAMITLQCSRKAGKSAVRIECGGASARIGIDVKPAPPDRVIVTPASVEASPGDFITARASVADRYGNPVAGEVCEIVIVRGAGQLEIQTVSVTGASGEVSAGFTVGDDPGGEAELGAVCGSVPPERVETGRIYVRGAKPAPPVAPAALELPPAGPAVEAAEGMVAFAGGGFAAAPADEAPAGAPEPLMPAEPSGWTAEAPERAFAPAGPARAPGGDGGATIEFPRDELPSPYPAQEDFAPRAPSYEEQLEELPPEPGIPEDPFAPPVFRIEKSRKAVVEVEQVASKTVKYGIAIGLATALLFGLYYLVNTSLYHYHFIQAKKAFSTNQFDAAIYHYEKCVGISPDNPKPLEDLAQIHFERAELYRRSGDAANYKKEIVLCIQSLDRLLRVDPNDVDALYNLGQAYQFRGDVDNALRTYRKVLAIDPSYTSARLQIEGLKGGR